MKKYIRALICIVFSYIKFCFIKLLRYQNFKFTFINIVSPFVEISIDKNANLVLGKMLRVRSGSKIRVRGPGKLNIGDNTSFNHGCIITSHHQITIGTDVQFGPNVLLYDHDHDFRTKNGLKNLSYTTGSIEIGNNVWIGANVVILKGTKIGDNCVIGAGSIIKGKFPNNSLIVQKRETIINTISEI